MKNKALISAVRLFMLLALTAATAASAQFRGPVHFTGVLNDYVPASPTLKGSPWEMHGQWSMDIRDWGSSADFYVDMTMSGYGVTNNAPDGTKGGQSAHTHHIRLSDIRFTWDMTGCPAYPTPAVTGGFQISGIVHLITGNGSNAPFETNPPTSTLQVCITGGNEVPYSNMTMVFGGPAATHFGTQPIHGVVRTKSPL